MLSNLKLSHKGLLLVVIPFLFELIFFYLIFSSINSAQQARQEAAKSKELIDEAYSVTKTIYDSGRILASGWYSNDFSRSTNFNDQIQELEKKYKTLWKLTAGNHKQREHVEKIQHLSRQMMNVFVNEVLPSVSQGEVAGASDVSYFGQRCDSYNTPLLKEVEALIKNEKARFEKAVMRGQKNDEQAKNAIIVALIFSAMVTYAMAQFFGFSITRRLSVINENVESFANRSALKRLDGNDEISHLDHAFRQMAGKVIETETRKQEFLSMISHDMRTPLSALQGTLAVAGMGAYGDLNEYGVERMAKAEANVGRLIDLINDLLDIERIESGSLQLDIVEAEVWDMVSNAVDTVNPVAEQKRITLTNKCDEIFLFCDSRRVEQILINFLANAVKFSNEDSEVTINSQQDENEVKISVTDQGRGISLEQQQRIFQRFKQVEKADATEKKGYGLGLAIAKSLVEAHHGKIGVDSIPGEGATFWFTLPLSKVLSS